jgi:hypothetical protein
MLQIVKDDSAEETIVPPGEIKYSPSYQPQGRGAYDNPDGSYQHHSKTGDQTG